MDICEKLNVKFQSVFTRVDPEVPVLPVREREDTLENTETNPVEVRKLMKEVDQHKAHGPDGISQVVFTEWPKTLVTPLVILYNERNVPTEWKTTNVLPILNKGGFRRKKGLHNESAERVSNI